MRSSGLTPSLGEWLCDLFSPDDLADFGIAGHAPEYAHLWNFLTLTGLLFTVLWFPLLSVGWNHRRPVVTQSATTSGQLLRTIVVLDAEWVLGLNTQRCCTHDNPWMGGGMCLPSGDEAAWTLGCIPSGAIPDADRMAGGLLRA
ncbi:hypothetical protein B0H14DRAFT_3460416 [Mycena olivaceomarginata]|nr:hypothetical protein B0H14DRAFT_3460416 [Mycena olivaceomarginata]